MHAMITNFKLTALSILGSVLGLCSTSAGEFTMPNVLIILMDDLGYNDVGFMGSQEILTPHIDKLAASGMVFADAHNAGTTCSPSRASIMTGRYQQRFGHHNNVPPHGKGMDTAEATMGDAFKQAGYKTYYVGKWHLGNLEEHYPNQRGFDEFVGLREGSRSYFPNKKDDQPAGAKSIEYNTQHVEWDGYLTDLFTERAIGFIEEDRQEPFFMVLSYTAPHTPMHAKKAHLEKFDGHPRQALAAMMWSADEGIGKVLDALDEQELRENTLIFFLSDNGGAKSNGSDNGALKGAKGCKFEGGQRTPFILSWPAKIPAGSRYDGLVSAMDIYPTSAAAGGVDSTIGKPLDGVNVLPYIVGKVQGDPHEILFWQRSVEFAVRMGDYKLIGHGDHGWNMYNLAEDIGEMNDVSAAHPELTARMLKRYEQWASELVEPSWGESAEWNQVKAELYRAWLNNDKPHYTNPGQMKRFLKRQNRQ